MKKPKVDIPKASSMGFKPRPLLNQKLKTAIIIILILFAISYLVSSFVSSTSSIRSGNVAVIKISGVLAVDKSQSPFDSIISVDDIKDLIDAADFNPAVKAILFDINSPGGSAVASDELQSRISKVNKTTVALIRDVAASGAYWAASAADIIVANRMSIVGSVGVIGSYIEFTGLLDKYNLTYRRLVGGEYKDLGSPLKELTSEEKNILQGIIDEMHSEFIASVAENRDLTQTQINRIKTAEIFIGKTAKEINLVDVLGGRDEALDIIEKKLNITAQPIEYEKEKTFWEKVRGVFYPGEITLKTDVDNGMVVKA